MEKITRNEVKRFKNIISVGYCELDYLLMYKDANFYNAGVYGWNYDAYIINYDTILLTGYRPLVGNIKPDYTVTKRFNLKAQEIYNNKNLTFEEKQEKINETLENFINVCLH